MDSKKKYSTCNNFVFLKTLGSGYNAKVKLAFDKQTGKHVAVKIIKKIDRSNLKTLQNELNIMMQLDHQNIIKLIDVQQNQDYQKKNGQVKKVTYIVIELAEGGELFDYVANTGHFTYDVARTYFHQLIDALEFAHQKQIAHRDLKPENLLFDKQFVLKVADWGFATIFSQQKNKTVLGTESYMAPEINMKLPYNANDVDLFAAGIVLFILVVGTPPFSKAWQKDPYYNLIVSGKIDRFWQQHLKFKKDKNFFTDDFKDLLTRMFQMDPSQRLTIQQIKSHPWFNGPTITQQQLTQDFTQKKLVVDQEIETERQRKQLEKKKNQNIGTAMAGFRSMNSDHQQQFDQLDSMFNLKCERIIDDQEDYKVNRQSGTVYSGEESDLLFRYILVSLLEENIVKENITLNASKYKLDFMIQDDVENIEVEAKIEKYDEDINKIVFMRKSGNQITYLNYVKRIQDTLKQISTNE